MAQGKGAAKLRQYLADPDKIVICPGVHDGLTARMALHVGFDALYMVSISRVLLKFEFEIPKTTTDTISACRPAPAQPSRGSDSLISVSPPWTTWRPTQA
jgi:hypothetical protein